MHSHACSFLFFVRFRREGDNTERREAIEHVKNHIITMHVLFVCTTSQKEVVQPVLDPMIILVSTRSKKARTPTFAGMGLRRLDI